MEERNVGEPIGEFAEDETVGAPDRPNYDVGVALLDEPSRCRDQPMDIGELRAFGDEFDRAPGDCRVLNAGDDSVISNAGSTLDQWERDGSKRQFARLREQTAAVGEHPNTHGFLGAAATGRAEQHERGADERRRPSTHR